MTLRREAERRRRDREFKRKKRAEQKISLLKVPENDTESSIDHDQ